MNQMQLKADSDDFDDNGAASKMYMNKFADEPLSLAEKAVIVTKISPGFGNVVIEGLAKFGAIVCGVGEPGVLPNTDRPNSFKLLCSELASTYNGCELLVNTAEVILPSKASNTDETNITSYQEAIDANLETMAKYTIAVDRNFDESQNITVVNVISIKNVIGFPHDFGYIILKSALLKLKRQLKTLTSDRLKINNIVLGYTSDRSDSQQSPQNANYHQRQELLEAIVFLAADRSGKLTEEDIFIIGDRVFTSIGSA